MSISKNFSVEELTRSGTAVRLGIDNTPPMGIFGNLRKLVDEVLQPTRDLIGKPLQITSGYRSPHLNRVIGSVATSQHVKGLAADFVVPGAQLGLVFTAIAKSQIQFDQLILEAGQWIHLSAAPNGKQPRRQVLRATRENGRWRYQAEEVL